MSQCAGGPVKSTRFNHPTNTPLPLHHAISLQLTWHCNARCSFCAIQCGPERPETMSLEMFEKILEEVAANPERIWHVEVTGGEVFMKYALLLQVAERFRDSGVPWVPITNSFWATSPDRARRMLEPLLNTGMFQIVFSADRHHSEYIPQRNVAIAVQAAIDLGIRAFVTCGYFRGEEASLDILVPELREVIERNYPAMLDYHFFPALHLGRAMKERKDEIPESYAEGPCLILSRMEITPLGQYDACCVAATAVDGGLEPLKLGHAAQHTEEEMRDAFLKNPVVLALATLGPSRLYRHLHEKPGKAPRKFSSLCEACIAACTTPNVQERTVEVLERDGLWSEVAQGMWELWEVPAAHLPLPPGTPIHPQSPENAPRKVPRCP